MSGHVFSNLAKMVAPGRSNLTRGVLPMVSKSLLARGGGGMAAKKRHWECRGQQGSTGNLLATMTTMSEADHKKKATIKESVTKERDDLVGVTFRCSDDAGAIVINRISDKSLFANTKLKVGMIVESINGVDMKVVAGNSDASLKQAMKLLTEAEDIVTIEASDADPNAANVDHSKGLLEKEKAELLINWERLESYGAPDARKRKLLKDLHGHLHGVSSASRFLAAERLSQLYPQEASCLAALAENALDVMGFEEAIAASERLLKVVPNNSLAQKIYSDCQEQKALFDAQVAAGEAKLLHLPDEQVYYRWKPIEEIPEGFRAESNDTTSKVREMWSNIMTKDTELALILAETINREWAVETGRVENLYILSEGATLSLIANGITATAITSDPARSEGIDEGTADVLTVETIIKDQKAVITRLRDEIGTPGLNISKEDLFNLQKAFTKTARFTKAVFSSPVGTEEMAVLIRRGKFKNQPNFPTRADNLIHQYCPVGEVDQEIERLLGLVKQYEEEGTAPEVLAAWVHHRFTQIHPFHDGNGRVARSLASLVLLKAGLLPFTVKLRDRRHYFETLAEADLGNLTPFVNFIVRQQKETLLFAVSSAGKRAEVFADQFKDHFGDRRNEMDLHVFATQIQENVKSKLEAPQMTHALSRARKLGRMRGN